MDIRTPIKRLLRMCGHAFVSTVHTRLDALEFQVNDISMQNANMAETQTALLEAAIHNVELLQKMQVAMQQDLDEMKRLLASRQTPDREALDKDAPDTPADEDASPRIGSGAAA